MSRFRPWAQIRPVQQMEAAECGVACLTMILCYHGHHVQLSEMREICGTSRDGNSVVDLLQAARRLGLEARGLKVSLGRLSELRLPSILHWDLNHFVVLVSITPKEAILADPALGTRRVSREQLDRLFTGIVAEFWPGPSFKKRRRRSLSYQRYRQALATAKHRLAFVLISNVMSQVLALCSPAATQILIEHVITLGRQSWMYPVLTILLLSAIGQLALVGLQGTSQVLLRAALGLELAIQVGRRLTSAPLRFLDSRSRGDLLARVGLQSTLQDLIARTSQAIFDILFVLLLGGLMLAYDFRLGLVTLGLILARIIVLRVLRSASEQRLTAELAAKAKEQSTLLEAASAPELVKGLGLEDCLVARYERSVTERARVAIRSRLLENSIRTALSVLGSVMEATVLWYGGSRVIGGEISIGVFAGFLAIRSMLEGPLGSLVALFESWLQLRGAFERSDDVLSVAPAVSGALSAGAIVGRIEARHLGFRYGNGGRWVLRNVCFVIEAGQRIAIVGPSGHGKSTLAKMICGLLEPTEGEILLDGVSITQYERTSLAQRFGVLLQDPLILAGSVEEALSLRIPDATPAMLYQAATIACFDEVVQRLPGGYRGVVHALGANLSGGERQRLSLAQAVVGIPRVLVLDEGTSALDPDTEGRVLANLNHLQSTIISVAHKPAVVAHAQRVLAVADGSVVEIPRDRVIPGRVLSPNQAAGRTATEQHGFPREKA